MKTATVRSIPPGGENAQDELADPSAAFYNLEDVAERESNRDLSHEVTVIDAQYSALREVMTSGFSKTETLLHTLENRVRDLEIHGFERKASELRSSIQDFEKRLREVEVAQAISNQKVIMIGSGISVFISLAGVGLWKLLAPVL